MKVTTIAGVAALLGALQALAPQTPVFRAGVDLVQLDVSVLDKNRQPLRGLTQADFTIFEDGKPQTIEAFASVDLPDVVAPTAKWMTETASDVTTNDIRNQRMFIIAMDDIVAGDLWAQRSAKASAASFIDRLGPGDLAAVVFAGVQPKAHSQDLTSDHAKLKASISSYSPITAHGGGCAFVRFLYDITETLRDGGVLDRRKGLVYFGAHIPGPHGCPVEMVDVYRVAQQGNVNFYPVNTMGLGGGADSFLVAANETGGKAIVNTNDFEPGLTQIFAENASYYLLAYRPGNVKADGTFRRLEVKCSRKDVEVRTRRQYIAPKAPDPNSKKPPPLPPPPGLAAMADILPKADVPLRLSLAPFAVPGKKTVAVVVTMGVRQPALSARTTEEATLVVRAFTEDGAPRGNADQKMTLNLAPARRGSDFSRYDLLARMDLKPDKYELRVSAHSATLDKLGSVYGDVEVPDFSKAPLSLSGVLISATPGVPVAPAEALSAIVPVLPTTERSFPRTDRVSAFLRVYQGGGAKVAPVSLAIRIVDDHDKIVFQQTDALGAEKFDKSHAADERFALPLGQLMPGDYLLTFEATAGKTTARRDVRFKVS